MIIAKKTLNPNKLPFLQAQMLQKIYTDLYEKKQTNLIELAEIADYPKDSKILKDAVLALVEKGYLLGNIDEGFELPEYCLDFFLKVVKKNDYKHKNYSKKLAHFVRNNTVKTHLFDEIQSISELNRFGVVHQWYDYLEDFPFQLIDEKIKEYKLPEKSLIVDPFAGSGTTLVSANLFNCNAIGFDANPLMCFISEVKTTFDVDLEILKQELNKIAEDFPKQIKNIDNLNLRYGFLDCMPKKELNQWLSPALQKETILLKNLIEHIDNQKVKNVLLLALSKSCFEASYVQLCPGTTFYPFREKPEFWDLFSKKAIQIYQDLEKVQKHKNYGCSQLIKDTCLNAKDYIRPNSIDFIITSPPYPNDLEYTRQTRLEMYLLDFVKNMEDVQQIKKKMVKGSTKLIFKESNSENLINNFRSVKLVSDQIYEQTKAKNWGFDYPRMAREYFGDMYLCMKVFFDLLKPDAYFLQVVGDQTVKGVYIPVCDILIEMAQEIGYKNCRKELFRMRRSTGHNIALPEEIVIIQK
jgi:DNA modification methylase